MRSLLLLSLTLNPFTFSLAQGRMWGTYYGDAGQDYVYSVVTDTSNNVIIAGYTQSTANIASTGAHQTTNGGSYDAFLAKFDENGNRLWATYFGGIDLDKGLSVAVDKLGCIYLTGATTSTSAIATTGAQQTVYGGGIDDAFLAKFHPDGKLRWATYFGGNQHDFSNCVTLDKNANVIITGHTESPSGIATSGALKTSFSGKSDIFVAKYDSAGILAWSTYYGDTGFEEGSGLVCDGNNNIFVTGFTESASNFASGGSHQGSYGGPSDAFLMKLTPGGALQFCTYYGGAGIDQGWGIACDASNNIYINGNTTSSTNIASLNASQLNPGSVDDAFVAKFSNGGIRRWGTYFGGNDIDYLYGLSLNNKAELLMSGYTSSSNTIATTGAYLPLHCANSFDAFIQKFDSSGARIWGSYYGAGSFDESRAVAVGSNQYIYLAGTTSSIDSIASNGSHQQSKGAGYDGMLVKFDESVTGLQELAVENFELFPNPAENKELNLRFTGKIPLALHIISITGSIIYKEELPAGIHNKKITLREVPQGMYVLRLFGAEANLSRTFIVAR